ncbi:MAG: hypothetical protein K6F42_03975 [Bacteroidales bacterium]|nr:hypothetical protein [Bacteroidales bacterium]
MRFSSPAAIAGNKSETQHETDAVLRRCKGKLHAARLVGAGDLILSTPGWTLTKLPYLYRSPFIRSVFLAGAAL